MATRVKLKKYNPEKDDAGVFCGVEPESLDHFLLNCNYSKKIWERVSEAFKMQCFSLWDSKVG